MHSKEGRVPGQGQADTAEHHDLTSCLEITRLLRLANFGVSPALRAFIVQMKVCGVPLRSSTLLSGDQESKYYLCFSKPAEFHLPPCYSARLSLYGY